MFTRIAQANLDHYNDHPTAHNILTGVLALGAVAVIVVLPRKIAQHDNKLPKH